MAELGVHGHRQCRLAAVAVRRTEAVLDVLQERKRQAPAELLVRHAQVRDHVLAHIVEHVSVQRSQCCKNTHTKKKGRVWDDDSPVVHIAHLAILLRDLLENAPCDLRKVPCAAAVLSKHSGAACGKSVDDWHLVDHQSQKKKKTGSHSKPKGKENEKKKTERIVFEIVKEMHRTNI